MSYIPPQLRPFKVLANKPLGHNLFEFLIAPSDNAPLFSFAAGQWVMLHVLNEDGTTWGKAAFTIASAPYESDEALVIAVKVYGDYTKRLQELKVGDAVKAQGPYGAFILKEGDYPLVMLAGGIGITPFRAMLREMQTINDPRDVTLFYSNRSLVDSCYLEEFFALEKAWTNLRMIPIMTRDAPPGWTGETRRLDHEMLEKYLPSFSDTDYLMCGSDEFMDDIKSILLSKNVDVKVHLRKESFN